MLIVKMIKLLDFFIVYPDLVSLKIKYKDRSERDS